MSSDAHKLVQISKSIKLLYVEDDDDARQTTLKLLSNFFDDITIAVDGLDGINKFQNSKFDLIISDINMPELNGLEMLKVIREIDKDISVLMLSAHDDSVYFVKAIELNVDGYILKPLQLEQFTTTLIKIIQKINLLEIQKDYQKHLEDEIEMRSTEIRYKLYHDDLTNLYSRYSFFQDISELDSPIIMLVDINQFKTINEVYGNDIGSKVLKEFGDFLFQRIEDKSYKVYRLSGDEFAIIDSAVDVSKDKHELLLECLFKHLNDLKIQIGNISISLDATIGLASVTEYGYESAKIALDYAKKYKKQFVVYSQEIDKRKESSITLKCKDDISLAIEEQRVIAVYQGIVDAKGCIVKYETLMRLEEKGTKKLQSPYFFLDVAIKTRLYSHLSMTVIFKALNILKDTSEVLSVNFTYSDIKNTVLIDKIEKFLKQNKDIGSRLIVEITEDESIENYDDVKAFIKRFRAYGVKIAIDDFGTGFSNFQYILEIEPDYLKIDGSLVKDIDTNQRSFTLVEAIVQFSHKLGIKVIAEFVHSETIFEMLKDLNVDEYQGFYFHEPKVELGSRDDCL